MSTTLAEILVAVRELSYDRYPIPVFILKAKTGKYVTNSGTNTQTCVTAITTPASVGVYEISTVTVGAPVVAGDIYTAYGKTYQAIAGGTVTSVATALTALLNADTDVTDIMTVTSAVGVITFTALTTNTELGISSSANNLRFKILPTANSVTPDYAYTYSTNENTDTVSNLITDLIGNGYPVAHTGYFKASEKTSALIKYTKTSLDNNLTFLKRFFLTDTEMTSIVLDYFHIVLALPDEVAADLAVDVLELDETTINHLLLWVSIQCVELRRIAEVAVLAASLSFSDDNGLLSGTIVPKQTEQVNVNIGSVFSISDDNTMTSQYFQEDFNRVGSDNVLGDKDSFWFKIFLSLRKKLEGQYQDFYFRDDNAIFGQITLDKNTNFLAYYDSYPYTFSPLARNVMTN